MRRVFESFSRALSKDLDCQDRYMNTVALAPALTCSRNYHPLRQIETRRAEVEEGKTEARVSPRHHEMHVTARRRHAPSHRLRAKFVSSLHRALTGGHGCRCTATEEPI